MDVIHINFLEELLGVKFSEKELELIDSRVRTVSFKKGDFPVNQGETPTNLYVIIKGLVRGVYTDEQGCEVTKCFSAEKQFFSAEGLMSNTVASYNVECLENVSCIEIPYKVLEYVRNANPDIGRSVYDIIVKGFLDAEKRTKGILMESAADRYEQFVKENPALSKRLKQKYIASYLGISPVSLSRLRKSPQKSEK